MLRFSPFGLVSPRFTEIAEITRRLTSAARQITAEQNRRLTSAARRKRSPKRNITERQPIRRLQSN
ncbi:MAG: hypothetical protein ACRCUY_08645 [Thermoguttaceae bacterium]